MKSRIDEQGRECYVCKTYKLWECFNLNPSEKSGHCNRCKDCTKAYRQTPEYRERNRKRMRQWFDNPVEREKQNERVRAYYKCPEVIAKMKTREFKDASNERQRKWLKTRVRTPEQIEQQKTSLRARMKKFLLNPRNRMSNRMSCAIKRLLRGQKQGRHWETLVGYTIDDLRSHLEKLFKPEMTWENYGKSGWHIDHVKPVTAFHYTSYDDSEFKACWTLENLMPRWCTTEIAIAHGSRFPGNLNKGNRWKFYQKS